MGVSVLMPQLGLTMTEGTVGEWLRKPGDSVHKGETLFIVSTDKADMEVESLVEGTLSRIVIEAGKTVPVGTVIAYIEESPGDAQLPGAAEARAVNSDSRPLPLQAAGSPWTASTVPAPAAPRRHTGNPPASPRARRLARELNIDLANIHGSGPGGCIVAADVRRSAETARPSSAAPAVRRRQLLAERMTRSVQTIPPISVALEANAEPLLGLYRSQKESVSKETGLKLTVTDLLLKVLGLALVETPAMNAVWEEEGIRRRSAIDFGLATEIGLGVVAPVIRDLDALDLAAVTLRRHDLTERARQGRLALADLEGGVGTLSNLGMYRVDHFQALITPGQSFVLAVGQIRNRPWVEGSVLLVRPTVRLQLSVDHRVADGVTAVVFLDQIAALIEDPARILKNSAGR